MKNSCYITGIRGQDASFMADILLERGYKVYGLGRRTSNPNNCNIQHILNNPDFEFLEGDVLDAIQIREHINTIRPEKIFHFACNSHVGNSYKNPSASFQSVSLGTLNILDAVVSVDRNIKVYSAGSSEEFGCSINPNGFQNEATPLAPRSPYACGKVASRHLCATYKYSYSLFTCCSWLFNHESERRGIDFLTRKVTSYIASILRYAVYGLGETKPVFMHDVDPLKLGNLDACRDWGYAKDYMKCIDKIMDESIPDDYVIATGKTYSVKDFVKIAFDLVGLDYQDYTIIDPSLVRPTEVVRLRGDFSKASRKLGWKPETTLDEMIGIMLKHDIAIQNEKEKTRS